MGDGTAEIATLSQKLAALAVAETDKDNVFLQDRSRHNATEADKDHASRLFTSRNADKAKGAPTVDDLRERMAATSAEMNNPVEGRTKSVNDGGDGELGSPDSAPTPAPSG